MPLGLGHLAGGKSLHPGNYIDWTKRWGRSGFMPFDLLREPSEKGSSHPRAGSKPSEQSVLQQWKFCRQHDDPGHLYHKIYSFDDPGAIDY